MNGLTQQSANVTPVPVGSVLWRTYEEGGWRSIEDGNVEQAQRYFNKANEAASRFPEGDVRRGRTLAGLAWVDYRLAQQTSEPGKKPLDPETLFRSAREKATQAINILKAVELSALEQQYFAKAHHLLGLISIELCDGSDAVTSLELAGKLFKQLQLDKDYFDVLFLLAKLRQCRRQFVAAIKLFRQIFDEAPELERRFKALVDWANTLSWAGYVREAWQLRSQWQQLEREVEKIKEEDRPLGEILRGRLVFARIHMLYGEFDIAEEHLESAFCRMQPIPDKATVCCTVYWILSAQLALARGDLSRVEKCLHQYNQLVHKIPLSATGYGCLEVVAIDAACQICVLETYCYEYWRRRCRCIRGCWRIYFTKEVVQSTKHERKPIDFGAILADIANGIRAGLEFHKGRLTVSKMLLHGSITGIQGHLHTQSPLLIPLRLLLAEVMQASKDSPAKVQQQLQLASDIVSAIGASPHPFSADRDRLLANWRFQRSEYDLAKDLYGDSLKHSRNFRREGHPDHVATQVQLAAASGAAALWDDDGAEDLRRAKESMWPLIEKLQRVLCCYDYRVGEAQLACIWLCFLAGCVNAAQRGFADSTNYWADRNVKLRLPEPEHDRRQAPSLLGAMLTSVENHVIPSDEQFGAYVNLATREIGRPMAAFELNRVGYLTMQADLRDAALFCFEKSCELYPQQMFGGSQSDAQEKLKELALPAGQLPTKP